jgi:hypothetical protein
VAARCFSTTHCAALTKRPDPRDELKWRLLLPPADPRWAAAIKAPREVGERRLRLKALQVRLLLTAARATASAGALLVTLASRRSVLEVLRC